MTIDIPFIWVAFIELLSALPITLLLTIVPLLAGFFIGIGVSLIRIYKLKYFYRIANGYVSFFRGTPIIMHIMLIYYGFPYLLDLISEKLNLGIQSKDIPIILFVLTALSLAAGAYLSEIIRSGILSVSNGQMEAANSIGMTRYQAMIRIVLPQALASSIPNFINISVGFLHTSSIAFLLSQKELTGATNIIASTNLKFLESFIAASFIYWGLTIFIEGISSLIEKKVRVFNRGGVS